MLEWVIYGFPWWVWALLFLGLYALGLFLAAGIFGWKRVRPFALPFLAIIAAFAMLHRSRQEGWEDKVKKDLKAADKLIDRAAETRRRAEAEIAAQQKKGKLRDDDGFRRE